MVKQSEQSISVMMDGESTEFELRRMLNRIQEEPELELKWQKYHFAQSAMHSENVAPFAIDISSKVMHALDSEPEHKCFDKAELKSNTASSGWKSLVRPFTSMATAASVTAVIILGAQGFNSDTNGQEIPNYHLTSNVVPANMVKAGLRHQPIVNKTNAEEDIIRLPQGLNQYIYQHQQMLSKTTSTWSYSWLPEGYQEFQRNQLPYGEVRIFTNGHNAFSLYVEDYGHQSISDGVARAKGMVAVNKHIGNQSVTVVGDMPLMMAERIAAAVNINQ